MPCIRSVVQDGNKTHRFTLDETSTVGDLAARLLERSVLPVESMRLIANGRELELKEPLSRLGEFFFFKNAIHLLEVDHNACREWQKTGRCKKGSSCLKNSTHDISHSPRYVAYRQAPSSTSSSAASSAGSSPQQSPQITPPNSPPQRSTVQVDTASGLEAQECGECSHSVVCRNWQAEGCCRFGSRCHFAASHTQENMPTTKVIVQQQQQQPPEVSSHFQLPETLNQWASPILLSETENSHTEDEQQSPNDCPPDQYPLQHEFQQQNEYHWFDQNGASFVTPGPYHSYEQYPHVSNPGMTMMAPNCGYQQEYSDKQYSRLWTPHHGYHVAA